MQTITGMATKSRKELQKEYNVGPNTFAEFLKKIPGNFFENIKRRKILTPNEVNIIYSHLGHPNPELFDNSTQHK